MQEQSESVVVEASVAVADSADLLNEQVHGFGEPVAGAAGVEVGQELFAPHREGAAESGNLGQGAVQELVDESVGVNAAGDQVGLGVGEAELLRGPPRDGDLTVWLIDGVTERARRAVGLWPTPEDLADRFVVAFNRAADEAENADQTSKLRRIADAVGAVGRDVLVKVASELLTRNIPS